MYVVYNALLGVSYKFHIALICFSIYWVLFVFFFFYTKMFTRLKLIVLIRLQIS